MHVAVKGRTQSWTAGDNPSSSATQAPSSSLKEMKSSSRFRTEELHISDIDTERWRFQASFAASAPFKQTTEFSVVQARP